jgi:hypothetical protein
LRQCLQRAQVDGDLGVRHQRQQQNAGEKPDHETPGQVNRMSHRVTQPSVPPGGAQ